MFEKGRRQENTEDAPQKSAFDGGAVLTDKRIIHDEVGRLLFEFKLALLHFRFLVLVASGALLLVTPLVRHCSVLNSATVLHGSE